MESILITLRKLPSCINLVVCYTEFAGLLFTLSLLISFLCSWLMVDSCPLTLICFKSVLSDASKKLSAPYPLTPPFGGRNHKNLYHENLVWIFKTNSSAGITDHSLNILFILVLRFDLVIQKTKAGIPKNLPSEGEMFSRSWSFLIAEQGEEMGSKGEFLWGRVHVQDISVPGMTAQVLYYAECLLSVCCPVRIIPVAHVWFWHLAL